MCRGCVERKVLGEWRGAGNDSAAQAGEEEKRDVPFTAHCTARVPVFEESTVCKARIYSIPVLVVCRVGWFDVNYDHIRNGRKLEGIGGQDLKQIRRDAQHEHTQEHRDFQPTVGHESGLDQSHRLNLAESGCSVWKMGQVDGDGTVYPIFLKTMGIPICQVRDRSANWSRVFDTNWPLLHKLACTYRSESLRDVVFTGTAPSTSRQSASCVCGCSAWLYKGGVGGRGGWKWLCPPRQHITVWIRDPMRGADRSRSHFC
ncbi:protein of unknown function [Nitrospira japonica]|uniref:Uncharacterized protein n=1 Tax=Nitrospira japonica TaxID=1325564 RepID=A0A1W1I2G5_9BACT|nr:protein of unknown function [Nitrospira japonica]